MKNTTPRTKSSSPASQKAALLGAHVLIEKVGELNGREQGLPLNLETKSDEDLANAINGSLCQIETAIHNARQHASAALNGALHAGAYLLEIKRRFGKSGWGSWVEKNCPDLPISSAYRYMDLSRKFPHVRNPEKITGLRQAYIKVGILPEDPPKKAAPPNLERVPTFTATDLVARVKSMREFYGAELERFDFGSAEPSVRQQLEDEIRALLTELNEFMKRVVDVDSLKAAKVVGVSTVPRRKK